MNTTDKTEAQAFAALLAAIAKAQVRALAIAGMSPSAVELRLVRGPVARDALTRLRDCPSSGLAVEAVRSLGADRLDGRFHLDVAGLLERTA